MRNANYILLLLISLCLPLCANATILYDVIDLGTLGGEDSCARSVNESGQVVGASQDSSGRFRATLFDPTGGGNNVDLGAISGSTTSQALYINDCGQIVGDCWIGGVGYQATLFDPTGNGNNTALRPYTGFQNWAKSINNSGQIIGSCVGPGVAFKGYVAVAFDRGGNWWYDKRLGTLGGHESRASSINDAGQIVGWAENPSGDRRATLFDPTGYGNNVDLGAAPGYSLSSAVSINEAGQIVGSVTDSSGHHRAALFDPTGTGYNIELGTIGGESSETLCINDIGQIVGWGYDSLGRWHAVLFDPTGGGNNIDLNTLIDPDSGWTLKSACSINNHAWIVGQGINPDGYTRGFLLKPIPEPATIALLSLGALFVTRRGKRASAC